jgi:hypothetical protein
VRYIVIRHHIFFDGVGIFRNSFYCVEHKYLLPSGYRRYVCPSSPLTKTLELAEVIEVLKIVRNCQAILDFKPAYISANPAMTEGSSSRGSACISC